jgi:hypothetical protein
LYPTQAALAGALRVPDGSSTMSQFVVGKALRGEPVGVTFARAVAQLKGITFEELVSGTPPNSATAGLRHDELPGWAQAAEELVAHEMAPAFAVRGAGRGLVSFLPAKVNVPYAFDQAMLWMKHAPFEVRRAAEAKDIEETLAREDAMEDDRRGWISESGPVRQRESGILLDAEGHGRR